MPPQVKTSHYEYLRDKWTDRHRALRDKLWVKHGESLSWFTDQSKRLAVSSLAALFLLVSPVLSKLTPNPTQSVAAQGVDTTINKSVFLIADLANVLPKEISPLTDSQEKQVIDILSRNFNFKVAAELDGKRLNRNYGLIGQEQHLARYPGDNMETHFDSESEAKQYWSSGMASGLGAWGYFATSYETFTKEDSLREKYYIAVPTFLSPGFSNNVAEYNNFFKYRKMLVVNPENGKAIITVIGDSGPAEWTGKNLGGSPEVMSYLQREDGMQKGPVLYFFVDDPNNQIPLGPVKI